MPFIRCRRCSELFLNLESFEQHKKTCKGGKELPFEETRTDRWVEDLNNKQSKAKPEKKTGTLEDYLDET